MIKRIKTKFVTWWRERYCRKQGHKYKKHYNKHGASCGCYVCKCVRCGHIKPYVKH